MTRIHMEVTRKDAQGNDQVFSFSVPFGSAYQDCYDAAIEISNQIVEISKKAQDRQEQAESVEEPQGV